MTHPETKMGKMAMMSTSPKYLGGRSRACGSLKSKLLYS